VRWLSCCDYVVSPTSAVVTIHGGIGAFATLDAGMRTFVEVGGYGAFVETRRVCVFSLNQPRQSSSRRARREQNIARERDVEVVRTATFVIRKKVRPASQRYQRADICGRRSEQVRTDVRLSVLRGLMWEKHQLLT